MGYHRAGFDVVGVDIKPQPRYPFEFHQADALTFPLACFDAIHASPPCQGYTTMNNRHGSSARLLIKDTRVKLQMSGLPWVIENVPGARSHMPNACRLTGEMFGLRVHRPRLFETSFFLLTPSDRKRQSNPVAVYGKHDGRRLWTRKDGSELRCARLPEARAALKIDWMEWDEIREAIPPAYTEFIGAALLWHLGARSA